MTDYTEADVERLADILGEAQKRGIKQGSYTLARWILTAWSVEGSTPIASPARPCGMHYSWQSDGVRLAGTLGPCVLDVADHHERHRDEHGNEWLNVQWALDRLDAAPVGEVVGCPACGTILNAKAAACTHPWHSDNRPAPGEPVPVPPPVDALLVLLDKWLEEDVDDHTANGWAAIREDIETRARALWAAGVEEGRRLLDETAATAAVHAYELGIAEGRRQATEERTEEKIRIDVSLDSPEYRRQLLKMIRNGQIVVRGGDHG